MSTLLLNACGCFSIANGILMGIGRVREKMRSRIFPTPICYIGLGEKTRSRIFPTPICYIGLGGKKRDLAFSLPLYVI